MEQVHKISRGSNYSWPRVNHVRLIELLVLLPRPLGRGGGDDGGGGHVAVFVDNLLGGRGRLLLLLLGGLVLVLVSSFLMHGESVTRLGDVSANVTNVSGGLDVVGLHVSQDGRSPG